jgi:2,3,4,5-tetrahydropyridine-2-carboxylate N-succinyltransferase
MNAVERPYGDLRAAITALWERHEAGDVGAGDPDAVATLDRFLEALERGEVRAAQPRSAGDDDGDGDDDGRERQEWVANEWVKRGALLNFALRETRGREYGGVTYHDVLGLRGEDGTPLGRGARNTPDGTVVRRGAHVGDDAILMSPSFVNLGARVGADSLVDSCVTVGSCAQVGEGVKIGANTLIGGVLEPVEDAPVVLEDGATLGAGCRVTSGFVVGRDSVVAENTLLTPRIPVYDLVEDRVLAGRLPPERRAFTRYVESSLGERDLFEGGAYKPAVVALDVEADTREAVAREEVLRS